MLFVFFFLKVNAEDVLRHKLLYLTNNIASGSVANIITLSEMEFFNFLYYLIWDHYLPLAPTENDRPP